MNLNGDKLCILPTPHYQRRADVCRVPADSSIDTSTMALLYLSNICLLLLLFTFRFLDDNTLLSWAWVFDKAILLKTILILLPATFIVTLLIRTIEKYHYLPALLFILSFLAIIPLWSIPEMYIDSARYSTQANALASHGLIYFLQQWGDTIPAWTDQPLGAIFFGTATSLFPDSRITQQALTSLMFSGTIVAVFLTGQLLQNRLTGLYASLLLLGIPFLLVQTPLMMVDVTTVFLLSLAIFLIVKYIVTDSLYWGAAAAAGICAAVMSKYSAALVFLCLFISLFAVHQHDRRRLARQLGLMSLASILLASPYLIGKFHLVVGQLQLLTQYQLPALMRWQESHVSTFAFQVHPFLTIAGIAALVIAWRRRDRFFLCLAGTMVLFLLTGVQRSRYLLILFPILSLLGAYALSTMNNQRLATAIASLILTSSLTITYVAYKPFLQATSNHNILAAGSYLDELPEAAAKVIVLPQTGSVVNPQIILPLLDIHTRKRLVVDEKPQPGMQISQDVIKISPVRFSWSYDPLPGYRGEFDDAIGAIVVIASTRDQLRNFAATHQYRNHYLAREFQQQEGVFKFTTLVSIYRPVVASSG